MIEEIKRDYGTISRQSVKKYPLIIRETIKFEKDGKPTGSSSKRMYRSKAYDNRWYAPLLPLLYARQVGKYNTWYRLTHKGKPPMELPFSIENVFDNDDIEAEYLKWNTWVNKNDKKISVTGEEILQAELED